MLTARMAAQTALNTYAQAPGVRSSLILRHLSTFRGLNACGIFRLSSQCGNDTWEVNQLINHKIQLYTYRGTCGAGREGPHERMNV